MAALGTMPTQRVLLTLLLFVISLLFVSTSTISNLRRCADKGCTVTLSRATVLARYPASSPLHLGLNRGDVVEIKSKSAGTKPELWGGEVNGRKGYFPKAFVKEFDVKIDNPQFEVATEENVWTKQRPPPPPQQQQQPQEKQPQQQQPPPPAVSDVVKDETEIDETDVTELDEDSILSKEEIPEVKSTLQQEEKAHDSEQSPGEPAKDESNTEGDKQAQMRDPLLQDIEELQKSFMDMGEIQQDTKVFNDFLAKQFGSEDPAAASNQAQATDDTGKAAPSEGSSTPPETGSRMYETEIHDSDAKPAVADEDTETAKSDAEAKQEKEEEESPYIAGVRVIETDDEEEEKVVEPKPVATEEKPAEVPTEKDQEKVPEPATKADEGSKDDTEIDDVDPTDVGEEIEKPAESESPPATDSVAAGKANAQNAGQQSDSGTGTHSVPKTDTPTSHSTDTQTAEKTSSQTADSTVQAAGKPSTQTADSTGTQTAESIVQAAGKPGTQAAGETRTQTADKTGTQTADNTGAQAAANTGTQTADSTQTAGDTGMQSPDKTDTQNLVGAGAQSAGSTDAQSESKPVKPVPHQDSIVEAKNQPDGQELVNSMVQKPTQNIADTSPDKPAAQPAEGAAQLDPNNKVQVDTVTMASPDDSVDTAPKEGDQAHAVSGDSVPIPDATVEQKEQPNLLFQSEIEKPEVGQEKSPEQVQTDGSAGLSGSHQKDKLDTGVQPETAETIPPPQDLTGQGIVKESPVIQPDKTLSEPSAPSVPVSHQPVDIEFKAGQIEDSGIALESSQSAPEQQVPAETPTLQGTPSLQQAAQHMSDTDVPMETKDTQVAQSGEEEQTEISVIDGTSFYVINGEIADIVPESVPAESPGASAPAAEEPEMSPPPPQPTQAAPAEAAQVTQVAQATPVIQVDAGQATQAAQSIQATQVLTDTQPTAASPQAPMETPALNVGTPPSVQPVENTTADSVTDQPNEPDDQLQQKINEQQYQTNADFLSRKVLSVNSQVPGHVPPQPNAAQPVPAQEEGIAWTADQLGNTPAAEAASEKPPAASLSAETLAANIDPSASVDSGAASATAEELLNQFAGGQDEHPHQDNQQRAEDEEKDKQDEEEINELLQPQTDESSPDFESSKDEEVVETTDSPVTETPDAEDTEAEKEPPETQNLDEQVDKSATPPPDPLAWDGVPPPPVEEVTPSPEQESQEEPTIEGDPYQMDDHYSRRFSDEELSKAEEEEAAAYTSGTSGSWMASLEAQSKAFIDKLPPSIQSLLEQEPLGLSPGMTVVVTMATLIALLTITLPSCLCSSGGKKAGTKDPLVVVRELEEKLLMAVKEKENLEDMLQERQSEEDAGNDTNKRLKSEFSDLQTQSGTATTDLQNVTLHNEVLKNQISSLQTEVAELQDQLSRKADDVKVKDKKTKDIEKETRKLQDAKKKLEQNLQKKENERQRLEDENGNLKSSVQSLTDQVKRLDTSKQQLLSEAEDWKEKVDELKERFEQVEAENRQAQETISFKDNELEVMKDCYLQLKSFEKDSTGEGEEDYDTESSSKAIQEKIQSMMDVSKVNATLRAVQEEKDNLDNKLKIEHDARTELEEQLECVRREMESSMADKMKAERQCQEAQTKLSVLSSYFKDKELQLQRELGEQEALKKQNLSRLDNADENTRTMQKELEMNKQQVESLKRELAASERDFRSQIAANEKKAHENWLNARAAERELKESRHEAAVLRQKLTDVERRQMGPGGLIRPLPTRGMPPPGMLNGPPPQGMERSPSRGSLPPGEMPPGPPPPQFREGEFPLTARERERLPPSHPARHMPPPEARSPPPRMLPPNSRGSPPRMLPPDARSPPPYDRRGPPHPMDGRSPPMRPPHPDMVPPMRGPIPPHIGPPPMGSPGPRMDSPRDPRQGYSPYGRQPPPGSDGKRHQSQV